MITISWTILIGFIIAFVITLPLGVNMMGTQAKIVTLPVPENNTRVILDTDSLTQTLVNATTNETISVENLTFFKGNTTSNQTTGITNFNNAGNTTTSETLTEKFKALQNGTS